MTVQPATGQSQPVTLRAIDRNNVNDDTQVFELLAQAHQSGVSGALVTLTTIIGGGPRPLGAHMAVLEDGRYCGYVSGGCVEAAIARESISMIANNSFGPIRIGAGSPWFDLRLPCGGGLMLTVQPAPPLKFLQEIFRRIDARTDFSISLAHTPRLDPIPEITGWSEGDFHRRYIPDVQFLIIGSGRETGILAHLAQTLGFRTLCADSSLDIYASSIDTRTAVVFMDHDLEQILEPLAVTLSTPAFYIGALGSERTRVRRVEALSNMGIDEAAISRIHGPIGLMHARDCRSLAISVLAQVMAMAQTHTVMHD